MTINEFKELLSNLSKAKSKEYARKKQYERCKDNLGVLQGTDYSKINVNSSNRESSVETAVMRLDYYETLYLEACKKVYELEDILESNIKCLDDKEQSLIIDRFMNDIPMYKLKDDNCYTLESLKNKFTKIYKKIENNKSGY